MHLLIVRALADADPGDAGWGDILFVTMWAVGSLLLASFYCFRAFSSTR